jgi:hypothetical protein
VSPHFKNSRSTIFNFFERNCQKIAFPFLMKHPFDCVREVVRRVLAQPLPERRQDQAQGETANCTSAPMRRLRTDNPTVDQAAYNIIITLLEIECANPATSNEELLRALVEVSARLEGK